MIAMAEPRERVTAARYWLYTHWGVGNKAEDVDRWNTHRADAGWVPSQPVCKYLADAKEQLNSLLDETDGLLLAFFDPGLELSLRTDLSPVEVARLGLQEEYAQRVATSVATTFPRDQGSRVIFLTVGSLKNFIHELRDREQRTIYRWVLGERGIGAYDTPKVIEAFLRVRLIGSGVSLLRTDWDALVNVENKVFKEVGISADAVRACLTHDQEQQRDVSVRTWVSSAGYQRPSAPSYDEWSRGFATRIQPSLLATPEMCRLVGGENFDLLKARVAPSTGTPPEMIANRCFRVPLTERYLGVELRDGVWRESATTDSISQLGAHPMTAVISGALLNLSASAILDLPPFSNMTQTVMWIDDHLKFELHRALGHFGQRAGVSGRIEDAFVKKGRAVAGPNLAAYTWALYLPTLLLGFVMDAWIRKEDVTESEDRPLVKALKEAITTGRFETRTAMKLEKELRNCAILRIGALHQAWSRLREGDTETLASAWATSRVEQLVTGAVPGVSFDRESKGAGLIAANREKIEAISDLRHSIQDILRELIWDAVEYIDLTLHWPEMIQTIRAIPSTGVLENGG